MRGEDCYEVNNTFKRSKNMKNSHIIILLLTLMAQSVSENICLGTVHNYTNLL